MLTAPLPLRAETRRLRRGCVSGWAAARPARALAGASPRATRFVSRGTTSPTTRPPIRAPTSSLWLRTTPDTWHETAEDAATRRSFVRGAAQRVDASAGRCL